MKKLCKFLALTLSLAITALCLVSCGKTATPEEIFEKLEKADSWFTFYGGKGEEIDLATEERLRAFYDRADTYIEGVSEFLDAAADCFAPVTDTSEFDMTFVKAYQETEGETVYDVEEFLDSESVVCKYYFIGEELDKVETIVEDETASGKIIMDIISYEVDDSIFKVPWYSINIAFLVRILSLFMI